MLLSQHEKRMAQAMTRCKSSLKETIDAKREANAKRAEEVRIRVAAQAKIFEEKVGNEISRQHEQMSLTVAKQQQADAERRRALMEQELEYKERVR